MNIEDLIVRIDNFLREVAEDAIDSVPGSALLSKKEKSAIATRTLIDPAIATRVRLHAGAWADDVESLAKKLTEESRSARVQRAARIYSEKRGDI